MAIISLKLLVQALVFTVTTTSVVHGESKCKELTQWDTRHPNPKGTVTKCSIDINSDFNSLPTDADGLWLHFPKNNTVTLTSDTLQDMPVLQYLKLDITFLTPFPSGIFEKVYLPNLKTVMLLRDLNAVDAKNIAITLKNDTFIGLTKLENLYVDNLGIQSLEADALKGLDSLQTLDATLNYINGIKPHTFEQCKNLTSLKLSDNFLSKLDDNSFAGLQKLKNLDLSLNKLKKLTAGPFSHLNELELFVATSNNLHTIEPNTFAGLGKLHYLSLARNNLSVLDPMVFKGLVGLETLILDHNKVKLQNGQFAHASNMLHLYLAHNGLKSMEPDYFEGLLSLTELILSSNSIPTIKSESFYSLPTLITLDISDNKVVTVETGAFKGLTNLETLNIQENNIETMPPGSFDDLTRVKAVYMDQNPWECSCKSEWLILWLRERFNQIEPNVQFYYILCSEDDPIPAETFFALIMSEHFLNDLECHSGVGTDGTTGGSVSSSSTSGTTEESVLPPKTGKTKSSSTGTTEKTVLLNEGTNIAKVAVIVCSILASLIILACVGIHLYCRKRKQRTWDPKQKQKIKGNDMIGHKKVPSSISADPESGYLDIVLKKYTPHSDELDLVRPAYPGHTDPHQQQNVYYVYQNHALSTSLEYIRKYTDTNHPKRGDLSDDDNQSNQYNSDNSKNTKHPRGKRKQKTVVIMEPEPHSKTTRTVKKGKRNAAQKYSNNGTSAKNNSLPLPVETEVT